MPNIAHKYGTLAGIVALSVALLTVLLPAFAVGTQAQLPPPPPSLTPIEPITSTPALPTDTSVPPTDTSVPPTNTSLPPADTAVPATNTTIPPTNTIVPPTSTSVPPTQTSLPPTGEPTSSRTPESTARPPNQNPACQSSIQGNVLNAAGQHVSGATVRISATGFSNQTLTDSNGRYAFSSLCAGSFAVQATLPDGQNTGSSTLSVDGRNSYTLDLRLASAITSTVLPVGTVQPAATVEASMPVTGFSGWLLVAGAALGSLLLLSGGAKRALRSRR